MILSTEGALPEGKRLDTLALFAALSLFFSIIELLIPKPIPFLRIGLANLPLLAALTFLSTREFLLLVVLKIFGQAIVTGSLLSYVFLFSAVGSLTSGVLMLALRQLYPRSISMIGISVAGAFGSSGAQLLFASWFIFGSSTRLIVPPFLIMGMVTGTLLGTAAELMLRHSRWLAHYIKTPASQPGGGEAAVPGEKEKTSVTRHDLFLLLAGLAMIPPFILQSSLTIKILQTLLIIFYGAALGKRIRLLPGFIVLAGVCAASLIQPVGEVLFYIGTFPISRGALRQGLSRGLNLIGMVYLSRCAISARLRIPGKAGQLMYRVFFYFEELSSLRLQKESSGNLLRSLRRKLIQLDDYLLEWSLGGRGIDRGAAEKMRKKPRTLWGLPLFILLSHWILFFLFKFG